MTIAELCERIQACAQAELRAKTRAEADALAAIARDYLDQLDAKLAEEPSRDR